jgi:hypothetical protein
VFYFVSSDARTATILTRPRLACVTNASRQAAGLIVRRYVGFHPLVCQDEASVISRASSTITAMIAAAVANAAAIAT